MKVMAFRTTFALDKGTVGRLRRLAGAWHVSQAEVVRRAVALADETVKDEADAASALRELHQSGSLLVREKAEEYLTEVSKSRQAWRGES